MVLFVFPLSYRSIPPVKPSNENNLDESTATVDNKIPVTPCPAYDTIQFTNTQLLEDSYEYVNIQP